jgi:hypothetical protein
MHQRGPAVGVGAADRRERRRHLGRLAVAQQGQLDAVAGGLAASQPLYESSLTRAVPSAAERASPALTPARAAGERRPSARRGACPRRRPGATGRGTPGRRRSCAALKRPAGRPPPCRGGCSPTGPARRPGRRSGRPGGRRGRAPRGEARTACEGALGWRGGCPERGARW